MSLAVPTSSEFPTLAREGLVYLDTAATSQTVRPAIEAMDRYYETYRASIHRGIYAIASEATDAYEARAREGRRVHGSTPGETIFTKNATEAINLVAYSWGRANVGPDDLVVITQMEHHSNIVPWQLLGLPARLRAGRPTTGCSTSTRSTSCWRAGPEARRRRARLQRRSARSTRSREIVARAHAAGARRAGRRRAGRAATCRSTSPSSAPTSTPGPATRPTGRPASACCTAARELLEAMPPFLGGGHMIARVGDFESTWAEPPAKLRGGHDADRRGDRARRGASTGCPAIGMDARARARPRRHRATRSSAWPRCPG